MTDFREANEMVKTARRERDYRKSRVQTRRSLSLKGTTFARLEAHARANATTPTALVETWIAEHLGEENP